MSIYTPEAAKESLSMSSFRKPQNALYECGTIFRQCTHYLSHKVKREEGSHLRETRLHIQLLEDCIHVACGAAIPQTHKPCTGPAIHWGKVLGKGRGETREN